MSDGVEKAILAGGCFSGIEDLFRKRPGVISTRVGYTGGEVLNATYRNHGKHAEAIEIVFNPEETSYRELLESFFQIHDPTTLNRQGNDIKTSYRSAIFYLNEEQRRVAEETIADVDTSGRWPGKVVTEVTPAGPFWEAEPEHQNYFARNPHGYTCHFVRPDWILAERTRTATASAQAAHSGRSPSAGCSGTAAIPFAHRKSSRTTRSMKGWGYALVDRREARADYVLASLREPLPGLATARVS